MVLSATRHGVLLALPIMRAQKSGVIIMISSISAWENYPNVAYKITKAGMIAFTQQLAIRNAQYNIRANAITQSNTCSGTSIINRCRSNIPLSTIQCHDNQLHNCETLHTSKLPIYR